MGFIFGKLRLWTACVFWVLVLLCVIDLQAQLPVAENEKVNSLKWAEDFQKALKLAESDQKPILLEITTDENAAAKKMENETFASPGVQRQLKKCILVRVNPQASADHRALVEKYDVRDTNEYPYLILLNFKGEEMARLHGFISHAGIIKFLKDQVDLLKSNPLGYGGVHLPADDPLMKAISKMPKLEEIPSHLGSIMLLDQCAVNVSTNAAAKIITRGSYYIVDPSREPQPRFMRMYNSNREKMKFTKIRILDLKGEGRDLDVSKAHDGNAYSSENIYWDVHRLSFSPPELKKGQIIDVEEEQEIEPVMPGHFFWRWVINGMMIVVSDLTVTFPEKLNLYKEAVRCSNPIVETKNPDGMTVWHLETQNLKIPPEDELFAPYPYESWQGYEVSTPTTWDAVAGWFNGISSDRGALPLDAKTRVAELKKKHADPEAQLQSLFDWVTTDIRYVSVNFGQSTHQPHMAATTLKNLYGDCKDQSLLLQALCREAGINSYLILASAGFGSRFDSPLPTINRFNHCILEAQVGSKTYYLDPSAGPARLGELPMQVAATQALRIHENKGEVVKLPSYNSVGQKDFHKVEIKLDSKGGAIITETKEIMGYKASAMRHQSRDMPADKFRQYLEDGYKQAGLKLIDYVASDPFGKDEVFKTKLVFQNPKFAMSSTGMLIFKLQKESSQEGDWTTRLEGSRIQPFRFYPSGPTVMVYEVELPDGANLKLKPEDLNLETPYMRVSRKFSMEKNRFTITENNSTLDANLPATESARVLTDFRKLEANRGHAFIIDLPPVGSPHSPVSNK